MVDFNSKEFQNWIDKEIIINAERNGTVSREHDDDRTFLVKLICCSNKTAQLTKIRCNFSSIERRIYSCGKTFLCFIVFLICSQPLVLCYFGEWIPHDDSLVIILTFLIFIHFFLRPVDACSCINITIAMAKFPDDKESAFSLCEKGQFANIQLHRTKSGHRKYHIAFTRRAKCSSNSWCHQPYGAGKENQIGRANVSEAIGNVGHLLGILCVEIVSRVSSFCQWQF